MSSLSLILNEEIASLYEETVFAVQQITTNEDNITQKNIIDDLLTKSVEVLTEDYSKQESNTKDYESKVLTEESKVLTYSKQESKVLTEDQVLTYSKQESKVLTEDYSKQESKQAKQVEFKEPEHNETIDYKTLYNEQKIIIEKQDARQKRQITNLEMIQEQLRTQKELLKNKSKDFDLLQADFEIYKHSHDILREYYQKEQNKFKALEDEHMDLVVKYQVLKEAKEEYHNNKIIKLKRPHFEEMMTDNFKKFKAELLNSFDDINQKDEQIKQLKHQNEALKKAFKTSKMCVDSVNNKLIQSMSAVDFYKKECIKLRQSYDSLKTTNCNTHFCTNKI